jgi:hypothetical protein
MKHLARFTRKLTRRRAVVLALVAMPLLLHYVSTMPDHDTLQKSVFEAGTPSATPDHALLMASDIERALPATPRVPPGLLTQPVT